MCEPHLDLFALTPLLLEGFDVRERPGNAAFARSLLPSTSNARPGYDRPEISSHDIFGLAQKLSLVVDEIVAG